MLFYIIPISLFLIGMILFAILQKDNYLEKIQWLPKEEILFEDPQCAFQSVVSIGRPTYYPMGHACITNERIILAQRGWLGKKRFLRFVIPYGRQQDPEENLGYIKTAFKTGHILFRSSPSDIHWKSGQKKPTLLIASSKNDSGFEVTGVLLFSSKENDLKRFFP